MATTDVAGYPGEWIFDVALKDGSTVRIRPILPTDGPLLEGMIQYIVVVNAGRYPRKLRQYQMGLGGMQVAARGIHAQ